MNEGNSKVMSVLPYNKVRREALHHTIGNLSPITSGDALWDRWEAKGAKVMSRMGENVELMRASDLSQRQGLEGSRARAQLRGLLPGGIGNFFSS